MSDISTKLTYLNTTKQLLKTEINKINNVLDDNSTFRSYPQELFNGYLDVLNNGTDTLWNNLEKVSASGETPVLENVETAPIKMVLSGNTSQETTSGKNLQAPLSSSTTMNGITFTPIFEDGMLQYVNVNGTSTGVAYVDLPDINFSAGTYVMTGSPSGGSDSNYQQRFVTGTSNLGTDNGNGVSVTLNEATSCHVRIRIASGYTANNLKFYPMIRLSSITDGSYEPYTNGASPNPDYPQGVKVVKGENVVSVSGKNLFNNVVFKDSNIINANGEETYNSLGCIWEKIKVKPNTTYTLSYTSTDYSFSQRISEYDSNNTFIQRNLTNSTPYTFTTNANTEYINLSGLKTDTNIMIEQNSQATPYVPYSKTDYPINLGDIELCKINTYKDYFHKDNGKWYVHKEIGKVVLDGSESWEFASKSDTPTPRSVILLSSYIDFQSLIYYSNYFTNDDENTSNRLRFYVQQSTYRKDIYLSLDNEIVGISSNDNNATRLRKIKTWLSTHNTIVYYILATPTEEEITNSTLIEQLEAIYKAKSVKDKTYITQTNEELPFILDVEAIKEYEVI